MANIVYPYGIDIIDWFDSLLIDFPKENLPVLRFPEEWQEVGSRIVGIGEFAKRICPSPLRIDEKGKSDNYSSWEEWAKDVYSIMILYNLNEDEE